jgi:plasmid replication initiation protein
MTELNELKEISNNITLMSELSDEDQYQWYLRIKASLPKLKLLFDIEGIENAIADYEHRHNIV